MLLLVAGEAPLRNAFWKGKTLHHSKQLNFIIYKELVGLRHAAPAASKKGHSGNYIDTLEADGAMRLLKALH